MLSVSLLGGFSIRSDEAIVTGIDTPRLQALFAYLLLHKDAPQSRSKVAYLFWSNTTETQARTNLRNLLHQLRQAFPGLETYLETTTHFLQWKLDSPITLDVDAFKRAVSIARLDQRQEDSIKISETLEKAIELYQGDLLPSCYEDWILPYREELRQAYLDILERLVDQLESRREYRSAIHYAQRALREDPLQEASYRNLIRLYALNGDRAKALRIYHACATILQRELEVEPSDATRQSYQQLLGTHDKPAQLASSETGYYSLVGRDREWMLLIQKWRAVAKGGVPQTVIIRGEAGIGKTRLVEELLQWAARQGIASAHAQCYAAVGDLAYAPVITWLRTFPLANLEDIWLSELGRLLPEIHTQRPDIPLSTVIMEAWQRQRLFEALARAFLLVHPPLLLAIDDLQWCDRDTLEWLHFLLRFDKMKHLLVVGTYRPEEVDASHPLLATLDAIRQLGQLTELELEPLNIADTSALAAQVAGTPINSMNAQVLYRETEGNPLFVVELLRAGNPTHNQNSQFTNGYWPESSPVIGHILPPRVRSVLEGRLNQVSKPARELAELAATIGREFSFRLIANASNRVENALVSEIDELWRRRILREHGTDAYDFSHDKLREVAYTSMSTTRQRLLHHHIAQALEALYTPNLDPISRQLAAHYEHAGYPEYAIPYYLLAAQVARRVFANEEAITILQHGLSLADRCEPGVFNTERIKEVMARIWEELGELQALCAQHVQALDAYQQAIKLLFQGEHIWLARLHRKSGVVMREQRLYLKALTACSLAENALGDPPPAEESAWWREWLEIQVERIWAHYWLAQWPEMEALIKKAHPVVINIREAACRARFLMATCLMHLRRERYTVSDEMLEDMHEAVAASQEWGDLKTIMECRFESGFLHLWRRELEEAESDLKSALGMAETSGILQMKTLGLTYLTVVSRFQNREDQVYSTSQRALRVSEEAHMPDYIAAAKGNMAWLAIRKHEIPTAINYCLEALEIWEQSPLVYPFQWQALWPLLYAVLEQGREQDAWKYLDRILAPTQQLLPESLHTPLELAALAYRKKDYRKARHQLSLAIQQAVSLGY